MKQGWVKLYRKILDNEELRRHHSALILFIYLLLDCKDGKWSGGKHQLAKLCGLTDSSAYRALQKLKKLKICNTIVNHQYSEIYICNWDEYQAQANAIANHRRTTGEHSLKNRELRIKEIKNKEKINPTKISTGLQSVKEMLLEKGVL